MFDKVDLAFLAAALVSFVASVTLWFLADQTYGVFVGIWVPSILALWVGVRVRLLEHARRLGSPAQDRGSAS